MTLSLRDFQPSDLEMMKLQKEQIDERKQSASFLEADMALSIVDGSDVVCCIGIKEYDGKQCVAAFISEYAGRKLIELVRIFYKLKELILRDEAYFFVKKDFENANRLATLLGFKKEKNLFIDNEGKKYYIYKIKES